VEIPAGALSGWLKRTRALVPLGSEAQFLDVEALSRRLLYGAGPEE
jgi:hypothetical protein